VTGTDADWPVRLAAFAALGTLVQIHGPVLTWATIEGGFQHRGERLLFANQAKGIFRPAAMRGAALSVKTTVPRTGAPKYEDIATDDAFGYALQRRGPEFHDNVLLLRSIELRTPLIYFYGVEPGVYRPLWPVYAAPAPEQDRVLLTVEPADVIYEPGSHIADATMRAVVRRYATVEAKKRLHQDMFRAAVLTAYSQRCAVCRLPRRELLDAAHIVPDRDPRGVPHVTNGLALCKLHHGAYDANLMGVRPDLVIEVSRKLLDEHDGPTLEHGLKGFDGRRMHVPRRVIDRPESDFLGMRYDLFRRAG
jgi:putative restriction endonuclease